MRLNVIWAASVLLIAMGPSVNGQELLWEKQLTEYIGYSWSGELLRYRLTNAVALPADCHLNVTDEEGKATPVAVQVVKVTREPSPIQHVYDLYCVLDLAPYQTRKLQLLKGKAPPALGAALPVKSDGKTITASSGTLEIQIPDSIADGRGLTEAQIPSPLLCMRNVKQKEWGGAGSFTNVGELAGLTTKVVTRGPVFTDMELEYRFDKGRYFVALRLIRDQPLVLWRDETHHDNPPATLTWNFSSGFSTKGVFPCTVQDGNDRTMAALPIKNALAQEIAVHPGNPWRELWPSVSAFNHVDFDKPSFDDAGDLDTWLNGDVLKIVAELNKASTDKPPKDPEWIIGFFSGPGRDWKIGEIHHPEAPFWYSLPTLKVSPETNVVVCLPLFYGKRSFGISVDDKTGATAIRSIQYGQTPLDEVKNYVLDYDGDLQDTFPRRLFDHAAQREYASSLREDSPFHAEIQKARAACSNALTSKAFQEVRNRLNTWDLTDGAIWGPWHDRDLIVAELSSQDAALAPLLQVGAMASARRFAYHFFAPEPSGRTWVNPWFGGELGISVVDSAGRHLTSVQFRRIRARVLFMAYKLASDMFEYSREGRGAPLNMCRTHVNGFLGSIALLYPHHPQAREWIETAEKEMMYELTECSGPNGGWVEAPHYMTVSMDYLFAFALGLARAGKEDLLYHERLKQTVLWLAKISPPRDPRYENRRHFPEIGNTYRNESTVLFSLMARAYRPRDPAYADTLQWIWHEMGRPMWFGIGGVVPLTEGYREALVDPSPCPETPPAWKSEWFIDSGVVLRSHFATERENYLYLIQGNMHEHYDKDNGSIILWGKGRPLCEDWGYTWGPGAPMSEHNRMDIGGEGKVIEFAALDGADYIHSRQGPWDRQILFVKDVNPLGPNYVLLRDSTAISGTNTWDAGVTPFRLWPTSPYVVGTGTNEWRLWVNVDTGAQFLADSRLLTAPGRDDVDMDIWFDDASLKLLPKIREPLPDSSPTGSNIKMELNTLTKGDGLLDGLLEEQEANEHNSDRPWIYGARKHTSWVQTGNNRGYWGRSSLEQREIFLNVPRGQNVVTLLYPRLKREKKPVVESFSNDRGLKIVSPEGIDYVFLSLDPMDVEVDSIRFKGTAGAVQRRPAGQTLSLSAVGEIGSKEFGLSAPGAAGLHVGKDTLTVELPSGSPGGQITLITPDGYSLVSDAGSASLSKHQNGRYVLSVPAGLQSVKLARLSGR